MIYGIRLASLHAHVRARDLFKILGSTRPKKCIALVVFHYNFKRYFYMYCAYKGLFIYHARTQNLLYFLFSL